MKKSIATVFWVFSILVLTSSGLLAGRNATAVATVINGFVVAVTVTDGGSGYTNAPSVSFSGGGGSGASALALVTSGSVSQIIVLNAGSGYTNSPHVIISAPPEQPPLLSIGMVPLITIHGVPGDYYQIEYSSALGGATNWIPTPKFSSAASPRKYTIGQPPWAPKGIIAPSKMISPRRG